MHKKSKEYSKFKKDRTFGKKDQKFGKKERFRSDRPDEKFVALFFKDRKGKFYLSGIDKKKKDLYIAEKNALNLKVGDLVLIQPLSKKTNGKKHAQVLKKIQEASDDFRLSDIAIHEHEIPTKFSHHAIEECQNLKVPSSSSFRKDLRKMPLITIDGEDAKDFDDAVFAEPDPKNPGHWHLIVAIADVSYYVKTSSVLNKEALERGNSTYFVDQVIPMLPEEISNDLCSLRPLEDRACLAVHLWINEFGDLKSYKFTRGLMQSHARLTYNRAQKIFEAKGKKSPRLFPQIENLYGAYNTLMINREQRQALELDLPERALKLDKNNQIIDIKKQERLNSHMLIEEFMICANIAAAKFIQKHRPEFANIFRVHEEPKDTKIATLKQVITPYGYTLPKTDLDEPATYNKILKKAQGTEEKAIIHEAVLRTQSQASYKTENAGHFGLNLLDYTHFTSPIRRYADLCIHRKINAILEKDIVIINEEKMAEIATHISETERRSTAAERATMDRYVADFMQRNLGKTLNARISGVTGFGLFLNIEPSSADAMIPFRFLKHDFFDYDENRHCLVGKRTGQIYKVGDAMEVIIMDANPINGAIIVKPVTKK